MRYGCLHTQSCGGFHPSLFLWTVLQSGPLLLMWAIKQAFAWPLPGRLPETTVVYPADVVLFEGILVFYTQEIRDMFHLRLFVDTDSDVRLSRRGKGLRDPDWGWDLPALPGEAYGGVLLLLQFSGTCSEGGTWSRF